jgi:hypothetical protein
MMGPSVLTCKWNGGAVEEKGLSAPPSYGTFFRKV